MPSIFILEDWTFIRREWLDIYPLHLGKSPSLKNGYASIFCALRHLTPESLAGLRILANLISIPRRIRTPEHIVEVTEEVVQHIAELAQLKVAASDLESLSAGMRNILELAGQMQSVNTEGVVPVSNPLDATQRLRTDEVTETDQHQLYQSMAPETEAGLYLVPRVVE